MAMMITLLVSTMGIARMLIPMPLATVIELTTAGRFACGSIE